MKSVIKVVLHVLLPLLIAYALLFDSAIQPRPYLLSSIVLDWIVRIALTIFMYLVLRSMGSTIDEIGKGFKSVERYAYPPYRPLEVVRVILGSLVGILVLCLLAYWTVTIFLPQWIDWRTSIVIFTFVLSTGLSVRYGIEWLMWYRATFPK
jgi:hypothetical protein